VKFNEVLSPWLRIAFATDAFIPTGDEAAFLVGPSLATGLRGGEVPFPWQRLDDNRPLVYVTPGGGQSVSNQIWLDVLTKVVASLGPNEAQFVAVLHESTNGALARTLPSHVIAVSYAPQLAILERAAVVVTAGGANTVTESLFSGTPVLVVPTVNDQFLQGHLVERAGVGFQLPSHELDLEQCRNRLTRLLDPSGPERARVRTVSRSYRASDGASRAAELLVELARTGRPLKPAPRVCDGDAASLRMPAPPAGDSTAPPRARTRLHRQSWPETLEASSRLPMTASMLTSGGSCQRFR
jgi:UDP:flavonoid glycosyltransferase YjiC (YdhE family)